MTKDIKPFKISIIMPVLNEELILRNTLKGLKLGENEELIIVDGGSTDGSLSIARDFTENLFITKTGRANVMNFGAGQASGEIFLFLHADSVLPDDSFETIRSILTDPDIAAGAFSLAIEREGLIFRIIELASNLRARTTSMIYGDQGMFMSKDMFDRIGGFDEIPLMEDIEISRRLRKEGKIVFAKPPIKASPRRWLEEGAIYTTLRDWAIAFSYTYLKVSPEKLIKYYKEVR